MTIRPIKPPTADEQLSRNLIVSHYAGSISYGTATPESDVDIRGIFSADPINFLTPFFPIQEKMGKGEDEKYYELVKFMKLYLDANPTIMESLWVDDKDIIESSDEYALLREYRQALLSKKLRWTYAGYAHSQMGRIQRHYRWIMNPLPKNPPKPKNYLRLIHNFVPEPINEDLNFWRKNRRLIPLGGDVYGVYSGAGYELWNSRGNLNDKFDGKVEDLDSPYLLVRWLRSEYRHDKGEWDKYWEWKKHRNPQRAALEEKWGYDTKHGSHLIRLYTGGIHALKTGEILVNRPDAQELLEIRNGKYTYNELLEYVKSLEAEVESLYKTSELRSKPDIKLAAAVLREVQEMVWSRRQ